jgi:hypothetical protein
MYAQTSESGENSTLRNDAQEIWALCIVCFPKAELYEGIRYPRKEDKSMIGVTLQYNPLAGLKSDSTE